MPVIGLMEVAVIALLIALPVWALVYIRSSGMEGLEVLLWVLAAIFVPVLGPLAVLILRPGRAPRTR